MITKDELQGNWSELKGALQQRWEKLSDNDLASFKGDMNQLIGLIQQKTGESREAISDYCEHALADGSSYMSQTVDQIRNYANSAREVAHDQYSYAADAVAEGMDYAQGTIKARPTESIAVCFGAGLIAGAVLGLLLRNRS